MFTVYMLIGIAIATIQPTMQEPIDNLDQPLYSPYEDFDSGNNELINSREYLREETIKAHELRIGKRGFKPYKKSKKTKDSNGTSKDGWIPWTGDIDDLYDMLQKLE